MSTAELFSSLHEDTVDLLEWAPCAELADRLLHVHDELTAWIDDHSAEYASMTAEQTNAVQAVLSWTAPLDASDGRDMLLQARSAVILWLSRLVESCEP